ncbi:MAG: leucine dehydrogenase [Dehalococcoidia bacterium]|nr:leucine dehydrogenase [Dehalococcoidia bacterium]|tara:strand:+ start:2562 stop:3629 length:1068 start_codon:yes stop_codon:yes gene_type:complete
MELFSRIIESGHEELLVYSDNAVGLKAFIAIHDTTLGPACGGTRIWNYDSEESALNDVLNLSRAMTYKSSIADISLGGGKAVIIIDPQTKKNEAFLRSFGRFVDTLHGRYLTTTDVGTNSDDLIYINQETDHVVGLPLSQGGSGDTSIMTGLGVYMGMKACARASWGSDSLEGKTIAMQGFGKVAYNTSLLLLKENARIVATDISPVALNEAEKLGIPTVSTDDIYGVPCDIFSPNALGGILNAGTIRHLNCEIIAGGANNQLASEAVAEDLYKRKILYAPDYVINAGGIINVSCEIGSSYSAERSREKTEKIYDIMTDIINVSNKEEITTSKAADTLAENRIKSVKLVKQIYRG